jgi:hypothetical protein
LSRLPGFVFDDVFLKQFNRLLSYLKELFYTTSQKPPLSGPNRFIIFWLFNLSRSLRIVLRLTPVYSANSSTVT